MSRSFEKRDSKRVSRDLIVEASCGFSVSRQNTQEAQEALNFLLPDPDRLFDSSRMLKPGSRTHAGIVDIGGRLYVLKRYNCRGALYRIGNAFRRSRAVRTWLVTWTYLKNALPVPAPLICMEERHFRLLGRSYILMEYIEGAKTLREAWKSSDNKKKGVLINLFAEQLGAVHRSGILHGDLKWDNLLVRSEEGQDALFIVDLDGSRRCGRASFSKSRKDLERFIFDLQKEGGKAFLDGFLEHWKRAFSTDLFHDK